MLVSSHLKIPIGIQMCRVQQGLLLIMSPKTNEDSFSNKLETVVNRIV